MTMKLMTVMFFLAISNLMATEAYSQTARLTLHLEDATVKEVLSKIEDNSEFFFLYNGKLVDVNRKVSVDATDEKISGILSDLFRETDVCWSVVDRQIVLTDKANQSSFANIGSQQQQKITGTVTDEKGNPLTGVTVLVKGTTLGTLTDASGKYVLDNPPKNATLVFSFVGMTTQEITSGDQKLIDVVLKEASVGLDEVVVVGYGTEKKGNITGSIATVKSDELTVAPVGSTINTLAGRLPGLISVQSGGQPGRDQASISIRGFGQALWIVDGVEANFNNIDPNQIESLSILKDGSASIYGARAGNGVILVTTKRGKDQKPVITLNSSYTFQGITAMPHPVSAGQYAELINEKYTNQGLAAPYTPDQVQKYYSGTDPQYPNTDWYKESIRTWAPQQQHNLSVRGGSEKIKYYGFFGYMNQDAFWKKNGGNYSRFNLQSNIDAQVTENLSIQLDLASVIETSKFPWRQSGGTVDNLWQDFWNTLPIYPSTLPDPTKLSYANGGGTGGIQNISNMDLAGYNNSNDQNLKATFSANYKIQKVKGLSAKAFVNYLQDYNSSKQFTKPMNFWTYNNANNTYTLAGALGTNASLNQSKNGYTNLTGQFSLNYDNTFGTDHRIKALAVYEVTNYTNDYLSAGRNNFLTPAIDQMNAGDSQQSTNGGSNTEMGRESYIGRLNYSYKDKYLLETILRADASAKFPSDKRWGYFPSASIGWRLSQENFMKKIAALDELKLRAGFGASGLDNVGSFAYLSGYQFNQYYLIGDGTQKGILSTGLANPNLTWEKIKIYNIGTEFSLWKRKLFGDVEVFYRELTGIPATRLLSMPSTFGANLPPENLNSQNTRGFELTLGTSGKISEFNYEVSGNLSWSRAKWEHYEEPVYTDPDQLRINKVSGRWTDVQFGYKSAGLFTSQDEITNLGYTYDGNPTLNPGDIKYVDVNNDGKLDWKDQVEIGKGTIPHWMTGVNINLNYKNFDLSALLQGAFGFNRYVTADHGNLTYTEVFYKLRWNQNNNNSTDLIPRLGGSSTNNWVSDYWNKDASYLRLKVFSVGYNLPKTLLSKLNIQQMRIYFAGTNLFTLSHLKDYGVDPEAPSGLDGYYYPQQKTITFGLNVSF
jgi:TonB-linked SusC/RagA family outer membrane protein